MEMVFTQTAPVEMKVIQSEPIRYVSFEGEYIVLYADKERTIEVGRAKNTPTAQRIYTAKSYYCGYPDGTFVIYRLER